MKADYGLQLINCIYSIKQSRQRVTIYNWNL